MKRLMMAVSVVVLAGAAGIAFAGEVKGPPGNPADPTQLTNYTGVRDNANSNCAYSGLNDFDPASGQSVSIVQTVADAWKYYMLPHGFPGTSGACHGGTNEDRAK